MRLMLLRHGIAEDAGPRTGWRDGPRALTGEGRARMALAARGMSALGIRPQIILTSPLTRCRETAAIVGDALGVAPLEDPRLAPGMTLDGLHDALTRHPDADPVLACGHQPDLSQLVETLTDGGAAEFRKGSLALLEVEALRRGGGRLRALYPPGALRELAKPGG